MVSRVRGSSFCFFGGGGGRVGSPKPFCARALSSKPRSKNLCHLQATPGLLVLPPLAP